MLGRVSGLSYACHGSHPQLRPEPLRMVWPAWWGLSPHLASVVGTQSPARPGHWPRGAVDSSALLSCPPQSWRRSR